jgi:hypothetical protein
VITVSIHPCFNIFGQLSDAASLETHENDEFYTEYDTQPLKSPPSTSDRHATLVISNLPNAVPSTSGTVATSTSISTNDGVSKPTPISALASIHLPTDSSSTPTPDPPAEGQVADKVIEPKVEPTDGISPLSQQSATLKLKPSKRKRTEDLDDDCNYSDEER